jgi:hypothetical protein
MTDEAIDCTPCDHVTDLGFPTIADEPNRLIRGTPFDGLGEYFHGDQQFALETVGLVREGYGCDFVQVVGLQSDAVFLQRHFNALQDGQAAGTRDDLGESGELRLEFCYGNCDFDIH